MPETAQLYLELWVSLASLLRSYTAAHGLNGNRQATVELGEEQITVRHGDSWLDLKRNGAQVGWTRDDGRSGMLEMTKAGRLRFVEPTSQSRDVGHPQSTVLGHTEEEMDMTAEAWARELMQ
jgi:hypothetical protein